MNHSQKIIRASVIGIVANVLLAMMATTAMAQVQLDKVKIPADTRLYLQILEDGDRQMRARSTDATVAQQEAQLFVICDPDADTKALVIRRYLSFVNTAVPIGTLSNFEKFITI